MAIRLGLIGFGAIGKSIGEAALRGEAGDTHLAAVLVRDRDKHHADAALYPWQFTDQPELFFAQEMEVVVEAAGHEAVRRYALRTLQSGRDLITISVGAFADEALLIQVREAAAAAGRKVMIPSGALGGLDVITAAAIGGLEEVTIITRKPPEAWKGTLAEERVDLPSVVEPVCIYSGPAREAAVLYPQNVNVQAALGLAGIGLDQTQSQIWIDPGVRHNTHEIVARGYFGEIRITVGNIPSQGSPKTGRIVALSMVRAIRLLTEPLIVGL